LKNGEVLAKRRDEECRELAVLTPTKAESPVTEDLRKEAVVRGAKRAKRSGRANKKLTM